MFAERKITMNTVELKLWDAMSDVWRADGSTTTTILY